MVTANPFSLQDTVQGRLLDFPYTFRVESTSQRDLLQTIQGMYDVDALLYQYWRYSVDEDDRVRYKARITSDELFKNGGMTTGISAATIARKCCAKIGKAAIVNFSDFFPTSAQEETLTNYQSILSGIFSWTSQVPRRQINIFMRPDGIHFLQRGRESGVINLDSYTHTRPNVDRTLCRTMVSRDINPFDPQYGGHWEPGTWFWEIIEGTEPSPPSAPASPRIKYDDNGLVSETVEIVESAEGVTEITTEYVYSFNGRSHFLVEEHITTKQGTGGADMEKTEEKTVYHYPLDNGQRYSSVFNEEGKAMSGLGTYPYSDKVSEKQDEEWIKHVTKGHWVTASGDAMMGLQGIPVSDAATMQEIYEELLWINRKTQETVSLDVIGNVADGVSEITHVFDYDTRYTLGGAEYYLVSNSVNLNPRQLTQTLNLVRWY
ncbi:MAG: hypothetical protein IJ521_08230, partial [Schwartzia sp.]|nr:hypothetical protein [Schwartzia sp. (in: firmicutes)]